jgi:SAM-dependent methyltransferase
MVSIENSSKAPPEAQGEGAKYFLNFLKMIDDPLPEMREYFDRENEYLTRLITPASRVLDVGAGPARVMRVLGPKVQQIVGIERDPRMIAEGMRRLEDTPCNYKYLKGDLFDVEPARDFDLAFASYNFPGADDIAPEQREGLLKHIVACVRPGGHAVVSFWKPTGEAWLKTYYEKAEATIKEIRGDVVETSVGIFTRFTDEDIQKLADTAGVPYSVVHLTPMFDLVDFHP